MADEPSAPTTQPSLSLIGQYVRDLSFESPGAPGSILLGTGNPTFTVGINVGAKKQADDVYAVEITLNAKADRDNAVLFAVELVYGGVYRLRDVPEARLAEVLMIECPRLIFPFARQVLASVTQQGGFPPLMMEPVDFTQVFVQQMQSAQANAAAAQPNSGTA